MTFGKMLFKKHLSPHFGIFQKDFLTKQNRRIFTRKNNIFLITKEEDVIFKEYGIFSLAFFLWGNSFVMINFSVVSLIFIINSLKHITTTASNSVFSASFLVEMSNKNHIEQRYTMTNIHNKTPTKLRTKKKKNRSQK